MESVLLFLTLDQKPTLGFITNVFSQVPNLHVTALVLPPGFRTTRIPNKRDAEGSESLESSYQLLRRLLVRSFDARSASHCFVFEMVQSLVLVSSSAYASMEPTMVDVFDGLDFGGGGSRI